MYVCFEQHLCILKENCHSKKVLLYQKHFIKNICVLITMGICGVINKTNRTYIVCKLMYTDAVFL